MYKNREAIRLNEGTQSCKHKLKEIGFLGKGLMDLSAIIKTNEDLEEFQRFIILNDEKCKSKLEIVALYRMYARENKSYESELELVNDYSKREKKEVYEKLFCEDILISMVERMEALLKANKVSLGELYLYSKKCPMAIFRMTDALSLIVGNNLKDSLKTF